MRLKGLFPSLLALLSCLFVTAFPQLDIAPLNPAFVTYLQQVRTGEQRPIVTAEGYSLGLLPNPVDLSHITGLGIRPKSLLALPASYDLRSLGRVTSVKDQGTCGSCWSFATMGALESWLLGAVGETWDLSENNLKECHGFDWGPCAGGNSFISTAYLARREGPISEADDPYFDYATGCNGGLIVRKYLREALMIPDRSGPSDNDNLKQAIMDYGAIYTSMYWGSAYYNAGDYTYYYTGGSGSNHAVALVGWDDNRVISAAPDPGAWIVRNSWGASWGEGGYFYISYSDSHIGEDNVAFIEARNPESSTIYQYDPLGWVSNLGYGNNTAWAANIFTASRDGTLTAVAFYISTVNTAYEIYIKQGGPDGAVLHSQIGSNGYPGYYTIDLTSPVSLSTGDVFSVVVRFNTPGYNYPIPVEYAIWNYSSAATANPGESYVSHGGTPGSWYDTTNWDPTCNVCIKAVVESTSTQVLFQHLYDNDRTGWRMISFPCSADPQDANSQLGDDLGADPLSTWDPIAGNYVTSSTIELGQAYWAWFANTNTLVDLTGYQFGASSQSIPCAAPGWHIIGPAFQTSWSDAQVTHKGETLTVTQAADQGWIRAFVIRYDPTISPDYFYWAGYDQAVLLPWEGYWFKTLVKGVTLILFPDPVASSARLVANGVSMLGFRPFTADRQPPPGVPASPLSTARAEVEVAVIFNPVSTPFAVFYVQGLCPCEIQGLSVTVYDLSGGLVWQGTSDTFSLKWWTTNRNGLPLSNGIYLYTAEVLANGIWLRTDLQSFLILR